ncbi:MAG TPA: DUF1844 domain-containing protein [Nitrospirales bacterium]|nr:DUF1844 domain-containing protein [Nitrospirales bacterium]
MTAIIGIGMATEEEEEKGFVVKDRRARYDDDGPEETTPQPESPPIQDKVPDPPTNDTAPGVETKKSTPPRELTFQSFIYSLASSALMLLGGEAKEGNEPTSPNLQQASEIIEILTLLQEKTKGNLTAEEDSLLKDMLYTIRITYVERAKLKS